MGNIKMKKRWILGFIIVWIGCWTIAITRPQRVIMGDGVSADLSGYYTMKLSDCTGDAPPGGDFVPCRLLVDGSQVAIMQPNSNSLIITYEWHNGIAKTNTISINSGGECQWHQGRLLSQRISSGVGGILPGVCKQSRISELGVTSEGDLYIKCVQTQTALMLFLVPFKESQESFVFLRRFMLSDTESRHGKRPSK